jgi:hypothetical protein
MPSQIQVDMLDALHLELGDWLHPMNMAWFL